MSSPKIFATALFGDAAALKRVIQGLATLWPYILYSLRDTTEEERP